MYLVRMSSEAMVRKASSTFEAFLALVSKKGMPNDSANSFAAAESTTLSSRSLLLPDTQCNTRTSQDQTTPENSRQRKTKRHHVTETYKLDQETKKKASRSRCPRRKTNTRQDEPTTRTAPCIRGGQKGRHSTQHDPILT